MLAPLLLYCTCKLDLAKAIKKSLIIVLPTNLCDLAMIKGVSSNQCDKVWRNFKSLGNFWGSM